jgi:hypothetical protein
LLVLSHLLLSTSAVLFPVAYGTRFLERNFSAIDEIVFPVIGVSVYVYLSKVKLYYFYKNKIIKQNNKSEVLSSGAVSNYMLQPTRYKNLRDSSFHATHFHILIGNIKSHLIVYALRT